MIEEKNDCSSMAIVPWSVFKWDSSENNICKLVIDVVIVISVIEFSDVNNYQHKINVRTYFGHEITVYNLIGCNCNPAGFQSAWEMSNTLPFSTSFQLLWTACRVLNINSCFFNNKYWNF
jgi:hypothetical protein